ncbi:type II secretion system F family protein [Amphiplicatus metriothermophilus]|uniref:Tight adherence protein C n=1 Tax=Amphiplicatus metriothermophilus TaxID=1519374 RepID=A0A239PK07_9PROT|nr:type II secretion system F family protein [Amphiplicatus metriothermophilus]MBB5518007.1 tight adherence protein C [Amphiplicatus metriothermophilus]SNT67659.1 tight adherence protein C [Amphiplicatus metriothermophilus]
MEAIINAATDRQFQIALLVSLAAIGTIFTVLEPFLVQDRLKARMKSVTEYRERLRQQQREAFARKGAKGLRAASAQGMLKEIVENLKLFEIFDAADARKKLVMAGFRGQRPVFIFLAARIGMPFVMAIGVGIYVYVLKAVDLENLTKLLAVVGGFLSGFYVPNLYIENAVKKRQQKLQEAWPDALDLLLICVESGMSIEAALQKVAEEIGPGAPELAEELGLTTAELSYLQERKQAYLNLAERTGLESVKGVTTALVQSEKYGTPLGQSLRVMANESREMRMQEAEKKAAALPPKLTVPMIGFFLPVLFAVILGPAIMQVMDL